MISCWNVDVVEGQLHEGASATLDIMKQSRDGRAGVHAETHTRTRGREATHRHVNDKEVQAIHRNHARSPEANYNSGQPDGPRPSRLGPVSSGRSPSSMLSFTSFFPTSRPSRRLRQKPALKRETRGKVSAGTSARARARARARAGREL